MASIVMLLVSLQPHFNVPDTVFPDTEDWIFIGIVVCIGLAVLTAFSSIPWHFHQDEFITAYTSWTLPSPTKIDWFGVYPPVWVSQFPVLFHALQKPFLLLLGPSIAAVRISVWPYYIGTIIYVYALIRVLFTKALARRTVVAYIFFAPNLYLSSMGLHFISSTFFYIAGAYYLVSYLKTRKTSRALELGIFTGLSYMTYTSSYVTGPVVFVVALLTCISDRRYIKGFVNGAIVTIAIMLPIILYSSFVNNFFTQRISQVNSFTGTWTDTQSRLLGNQYAIPALLTTTKESILSLIEPNIGGLGGYNFGKSSLLDMFTASIAGIGIVAGIYLVMKKRNTHILFVAWVFLVPFVTGFILTNHPPPFHRLAIIYPLFAFLIAAGATGITHMGEKLFGRNAHILYYVLTALLIPANIYHTVRMVDADKNLYPQSTVAIADYIQTHVPPGRAIDIAAFPSFHVGQELLFRTQNRYRFISNTPEEIIKSYTGGLLIILNPTDPFIHTIQTKYPQNRLIRNNINTTSLGDLTLFVP
jgi:hypothetical protein